MGYSSSQGASVLARAVGMRYRVEGGNKISKDLKARRGTGGSYKGAKGSYPGGANAPDTTFFLVG